MNEEVKELYELLEQACKNQEVAMKAITALEEENEFLTAVIIDNYLAIKTEEAREFYEKGMTISEAREKWKKKKEDELRKEALRKLGKIDDSDYKIPVFGETDYKSFEERVEKLNDRRKK